jgi:replicative DNA helicase
MRRMTEASDPLIDVELEAALLGGLLIDNKLIGLVAGSLSVKDFGEALHGRIFSAILRFHAAGREANPISLRPIFQTDPNALGGEYLEKISDTKALVAGADSFAAAISDIARRRRVRDAAKATIVRLESDFDAPVVEIAGAVQSAAWSVGDASETVTRSLADAADRVRARHRRIEADGGKVGAANALISDLDVCWGPNEPANYKIVGGRPGMGKTTLACSAALGYSLNGEAGLYLHGEMTEEQIALRQLADLSHALGHAIPHASLKSGQLTRSEHGAIDYCAERGALIPLKSICTKGWTIRQLEGAVAREVAIAEAAGKPLKFAIVDYIQLINAEIEGREVNDDRQKVNLVSKGLRNIADRFGLCVIALSQLSRGVEGRLNKRPTMADLRESGKLEEDADAIMLLYREEYYLEQDKPKAGERDAKGRDLLEAWEGEMSAARGKIDLIMGKNRHDKNVTRIANFIGKYSAVRGNDIHQTIAADGDPILL